MRLTAGKVIYGLSRATSAGFATAKNAVANDKHGVKYFKSSAGGYILEGDWEAFQWDLCKLSRGEED